jgi:hypothetical protein
MSLYKQILYRVSDEVQFDVRSGEGTINGTEFTDTVGQARRIPRQHSGWQSVRYQHKRYQLQGGIRTPYFITLSNPL